jgi:HK97 gp10 family phage protein
MPEFKNMGGLIAALEAIRFEVAEKAALEAAAGVLETEAKSAIGTDRYGWPPLAPSTVERKGHDDPLIDYSSAEPGSLIRDTIAHNVGVREAFVGSDSDVAVFNELGTSKAPPRPYLGGAVDAKGQAAADAAAAEFTIALVGGKPP